MHWAIVPRIAQDIPQELRDPLLQSWQIAWDGHALTSSEDLFQGNVFWPLDNSLAFSDALVGYAPAGAIGEGPTAALVRYNVLFLFSYALAFVGGYLLAREMGVGPYGAVVAGIAFAYAPWKLAQDRHLHVISSGGIPFALFLLTRGYRRKSWALIGAGWAVTAWHLSLGFTLGLQLCYLIALLAIPVVIAWFRRGRLRPGRDVAIATIFGIVLLAAWGWFQASPYLEVIDNHPEAHRSVDEVKFYSPPPRGFLSAPSESYLWATATEEYREKLPWAQEQVLFPGVLITALGLVGLVSPTYPRFVRAGLLVALAVFGVLSLGFGLEEGKFGYRFIYDHLPGWQGIRTPGRLTTMTTLALALSAGACAQWLFAPRRGRSRRALVTSSVVAVAIVGGVLADGAGRLATERVPDPPAALPHLDAPVLHLPSDDFHDATYMFWSTDGFLPMVNGVSGFVPTFLSELREDSESFPDPSSVDRLRRVGVETVVWHEDLADGSAWERSDTRAISGLGIERTKLDDMTVFDLSP